MDLEFIYGLFDNSNSYYYVGRSNDLSRRLKEHQASGNPEGTPKERHIFKLLQEGQEVQMRMLDCGEADKMAAAEDLWITNLRAQGHNLLNQRSGDGNPYLGYMIGEGTPWTPALFENANWEKGKPNCKTGEWTVWIKGVQFFRLGKKKLRFWNTGFGNWDVYGIDMKAKYEKACLMLTAGTPENNKLIEDAQRVQRLKA